MEYVYAALLIHKSGKKVDEAILKKVLEAAGVHADEARVKATIAALDGLNIDEAISKAAAMPAATAQPQAAGPVKDEKKAKTRKKAEASSIFHDSLGTALALQGQAFFCKAWPC